MLFNRNHVHSSGLNVWDPAPPGPNNNVHPHLTFNGTSGPITIGTLTWQQGDFGLHPGSSGEAPRIRFTAPAAGLYSISVRFFGIDNVSTSGSVVRNTMVLFSQAVGGKGASPTTPPPPRV